MRKALIATIGIGLMLLIPLLLIELGLRFLPVNTGLGTLPVNAAEPIYRFTPKLDFTYSRDWDFALTNRGRTNNAGFVNDQDYAAADKSKLLAVVGDSFVEALMVPYGETISGRLAKTSQGKGRVYSFAASGAPLSQYLVWIDHARKTYRPDGFVIVVVGNDFDESLLFYKQAPGFHYYDRKSDGSLALTRIDFAPSMWRKIASSSALGRYLFINLQATYRIPALLDRIAQKLRLGAEPEAPKYVANTDASADETRIAMSKGALDAFFRDLPAASGVSPDRIHFVVDGIRYPNAWTPDVQQSFFVIMRNELMQRARAFGYEVTDMQPIFFDRYRKDGAQFDYLPIDEHWNGTAHELAAEAVRRGRTYETVFGAARE